MKQTAVEWFEYNLKDNLGKIVINQNWKLLEDLIKQAKEMEKQQIIEACDNAQRTDFYVKYYGTEQYYNETYKK
jgi:hypothetical protein